MDHQIKYVCDHFGITEELLFTKTRSRKVTDARAVLYNIMDEKNSNSISKALIKKMGFKITRAPILNGLRVGLTFYLELIKRYSPNE